MTKQLSKYYVVFILLTLFTAPGVTAYLFYKHPSWLGSARTNKGVLLSQPVELTSIEGKTKWRLLFWTPKSCEQECLRQLDTLGRVRLALGRKLYQVDQMLLLGEEQPEQIAAIKKELQDKDYQISSLSARDKQQLAQLSNKPQIYIMNPDGYLVLSYNSGTKPGDVYKDLKTLLNATEIKG
jgi:hypothetical protein